MLGHARHARESRKVACDRVLGARRRRQGVAAVRLVSPVQHQFVPSSIKSFAAVRPRPSDDPVMNTRAIAALYWPFMIAEAALRLRHAA